MAALYASNLAKTLEGKNNFALTVVAELFVRSLA
jgi:hypothetical protein